nr:MAG TPA: hypothetical protein [Bacteriophage sp.]
MNLSISCNNHLNLSPELSPCQGSSLVVLQHARLLFQY